MAGWLTTAMSDLPDDPAGDLYVRFLCWVRR
jgi:hypothetical protein